MEGAHFPRALIAAVCLGTSKEMANTANISPAPVTPSIRIPWQSKILTPESWLLTTLLKERTQFSSRRPSVTLSLATTYINCPSHSPEKTNPFSRHIPLCRTCPRPSKILTPDSCLLTPVLNKRTQFCNGETRITPFPSTTYLYPFRPDLNPTNPISPASIPRQSPSEPFQHAGYIRKIMNTYSEHSRTNPSSIIDRPPLSTVLNVLSLRLSAFAGALLYQTTSIFLSFASLSPRGYCCFCKIPCFFCVFLRLPSRKTNPISPTPHPP
jgi:hypothetical protein